MPITSASALVSPASDLVSVNSALVTADESVGGFVPPDFGFVVPALTGEVDRMWAIAPDPADAQYVFNTLDGTGQVFQDDTKLISNDLVFNRLRILNDGANVRMHSAGSVTMLSYAQANDGGAGEPNRSLFFYTSASAHQELRFADRGGTGGGYINWTVNTGAGVAFFLGLLSAGRKVVIILADSTT